MAAIIIPGQSGTYRHLHERVTGLLVESGLKKGSTGKYHFNLVASNGQVIATSEAYETQAVGTAWD